MNQQQIKYARQRAESIFKIKQQEIREKFTTAPKRLPTEEKLQALREGRFQVLESPIDKSYGMNTSWYNFVLFENEVIAQRDDKAIQAETEKLKAQYDRLLDELMLGDDEVALALLKELEKM